MEREPLSSEAEEQIALAWTIYLQADHMPQHLVKKHMEILDFYLDFAPTFTYAILDNLRNIEPEEWDD